MYGNINLIENDQDDTDAHPYDDLIEDFVVDTEEGVYEQDWHEIATGDNFLHPQVLAALDIKKKQSLSRDTKSEIDSDSGKSEDSNCKQSINESECILNSDHVPNVLEIMDIATISVAFKYPWGWTV